MPSKKPRIQAVMNEEYYKKFKVLCERDGRTESNLAVRIIEKYINDYEKIHGEITIKE